MVIDGVNNNSKLINPYSNADKNSISGSKTITALSQDNVTISSQDSQATTPFNSFLSGVGSVFVTIGIGIATGVTSAFNAVVGLFSKDAEEINNQIVELEAKQEELNNASTPEEKEAINVEIESLKNSIDKDVEQLYQNLMDRAAKLDASDDPEAAQAAADIRGLAANIKACDDYESLSEQLSNVIDQNFTIEVEQDFARLGVAVNLQITVTYEQELLDAEESLQNEDPTIVAAATVRIEEIVSDIEENLESTNGNIRTLANGDEEILSQIARLEVCQNGLIERTSALIEKYDLDIAPPQSIQAKPELVVINEKANNKLSPSTIGTFGRIWLIVNDIREKVLAIFAKRRDNIAKLEQSIEDRQLEEKRWNKRFEESKRRGREDTANVERARTEHELHLEMLGNRDNAEVSKLIMKLIEKHNKQDSPTV